MSYRLVRVVGAAAVAAATAASIAGCGAEAAAPGGDGPVAVVASTDVWASVVEAVGGDQVQVTAVVAGQAGDPHSHQVSARDAAHLRGAELVVHNGGGYDSWVEQALGDGGPRRVTAFELRPGKARGGDDGDDNEHVWYDLPTVAMVAGEVASQLSLIRPSAKAAFIAGADAFDARLDALEAEVSRLSTADKPGTVVATEPVAHYLLRAAGVTDATPPEFAEAIEEETDPPAAAVAETQRLITERQVTALVHNPQTETPVITDLIAAARTAGLPVVDTTETLPSGQDYLTWMGNQIRALSVALAGALTGP